MASLPMGSEAQVVEGGAALGGGVLGRQGERESAGLRALCPLAVVKEFLT